MKINKVSIIGNACSGKTRMSHALASRYGLPITHIDSIQFLSGMLLRDPNETRKILISVAAEEKWIIDGLGPLKIIEDRLQKADLILYIRLPLWRNYWWCIKRQLRGLFVRRPELPVGCFESTPAQTFKLFQTIWNVNKGLWVQLDRIFVQDQFKNKIIYIRSLKDFDKFYNSCF